MTKSVAKKIARNVDDALDDLMDEVRKAGEFLSDEAKEGFAVSIRKARRAAADLAEEARKESRELVTAAERQVRAHPLEAALIAAGVAVLTGLFLFRRHDAE